MNNDVLVPDYWVMLRVTQRSNQDAVYKILACWVGDATHPDYWKLNSGVVSVRFNHPFFEFQGLSGSTYKCYINGYRMNSTMWQVVNNLQADPRFQVELINDSTDFLNINYQR